MEITVTGIGGENKRAVDRSAEERGMGLVHGKIAAGIGPRTERTLGDPRFGPAPPFVDCRHFFRKGQLHPLRFSRVALGSHARRNALDPDGWNDESTFSIWETASSAVAVALDQ